MRKILIAATMAAGIAAPVFADDNEGGTLQHVIANGVTLSIQGMEIPIKYAEDGSFSGDAMGMPFAGTWRIDGKSLCTTSDFQPEEACSEYPDGMGPGDSFETESEMGPITIKINE